MEKVIFRRYSYYFGQFRSSSKVRAFPRGRSVQNPGGGGGICESSSSLPGQLSNPGGGGGTSDSLGVITSSNPGGAGGTSDTSSLSTSNPGGGGGTSSESSSVDSSSNPSGAGGISEASLDSYSPHDSVLSWDE